MQDKKLLKRCFTQNIDGLERLAGVKEEFIVEAHGTFSTAKCVGKSILRDQEIDSLVESVSEIKINETSSDSDSDSDDDDHLINYIHIPGCEKEHSAELVSKHILESKILVCECGGLVKPNIVFFGESLPDRFHERIIDLATCKTLIVMGTSLSVAPFCNLPKYVDIETKRILINREMVFKYSAENYRGFKFDIQDEEEQRDFFIQESCDQGVEMLVKLLGWEKEFEELCLESNEDGNIVKDENFEVPKDEIVDAN